MESLVIDEREKTIGGKPYDSYTIENNRVVYIHRDNSSGIIRTEYIWFNSFGRVEIIKPIYQ